MNEPIWSDVRIMSQAIDYSGYISSVVKALTEMRDEYEATLTAQGNRIAELEAQLAAALATIERVTWCEVCGMPAEQCRENH